MRLALLMLLTLLTALPAQAGPKRVLLIYGPGGPDEEVETRARRLAADLLGDARKRARGVHVSEIPFVGEAPLWVVGDVEVRTCEGSDLGDDAIRDLVEQGRELTDLLEDRKAAKAFNEAWAGLLCSDTFADGELLYDLHFYLGVAAFVSGDRDGARAAFSAAASVDPDRDFDARYPPEIEELYTEAHAGRTTSGGVRLYLQDPSGEAEKLQVDARHFDDKKPALLAVGDHLLQYQAADGALSSLGLRVSTEGTAVALSGDAVSAAVLDPGRDEASMALALQALEDLSKARRAGDVVVAVLDSSRRTFRYDPEEGRFEGVEVAAPVTSDGDDDDDDEVAPPRKDDTVAPPRKDGGTVAPPR